ncbi:Very long-chain specific acyl-CoA dehydrogenase [Fasciola hepatica]|uniref:Very long-chain specific acyl-CoA dehydrogenase, mitochondrial n=1 Tax=Fasciola hepatica TaxID=6192 RepID=A0A4E0R3C8_FASHE|nr:Very long-chain specific acyl-CoA dehydrogenase [Fasciola hepatica]
MPVHFDDFYVYVQTANQAPLPLPITNSFAMNMFRGILKTDEILPFPKALSTQQSEQLSGMIEPFEKFFKKEVNSTKEDEDGKFELSTLSKLAKFGAYGLQAPEEYNGFGLSNTEFARLASILGAHDLAMAVHLGAHQSIGYKGIVLFGTKEQKQKYLPRLASGKSIAAYCLTEPSSGSDVFSIQTRAELSSDKKHYILNGVKIWISNGGIADVFTIFAQTPVKEIDGTTRTRITAFIVERGFGGLTNSEPDKKMGISASNTVVVYLDNCKVPVENVLGEVGEGFKIAVRILNQGRFGMAAAMSGTMRAAIRQATEHAVQRKQFGRSLNEFENVQEKLTTMAMRQYSTEAMAFALSGSMDLGAEDFQVEAAISKIYSSESAWYCVDEAIQILGGMGYMREAKLERVLRDLRIFRIFEGANDVLRLFVSLTGLNYAGKHLVAITSSPAAMIQLSVRLFKSNLGIPGDSRALKTKLPSSLSWPGQLTGDAIDAFGIACYRLLRAYGKSVINEQFRLIRLADAAVQIYAMMCSVSRAAQSIELNSTTADFETRMATLICIQGYKQVKQNLCELVKSKEDTHFGLMKSLSEDICSHRGLITPPPIGF